MQWNKINVEELDKTEVESDDFDIFEVDGYLVYNENDSIKL